MRTERLHPLHIKGWDEAFFGGFAFLDEGVLDSDGEGKIDNSVIFVGGDLAVKCGNLCHMRKGCVLVHDTDVDIVAIGFVQIAEYLFRILGLTGE